VSIREGPSPHWTASVGAGHCEPGRAGGLEHWLTTIAPRRVRRRTLESYEAAVRKHLIPDAGRHRIDRLRPEHLDQLYTAPLKRRLLHRLGAPLPRILSRVLTVAVQRGYVPRNVATLVDPPAQRQSDIATVPSRVK
jgi:integrase